MEYVRNIEGLRVERLRERSRSARKWSRLTFVCLLGACLAAIWQERALAPQVHDRMLVAAAWAGDLAEKSQGARASLLAMSEFKGNGSQSQYDPITEALLKLRN